MSLAGERRAPIGGVEHTELRLDHCAGSQLQVCPPESDKGWLTGLPILNP